MQIYLASTSPARKSLLHSCGIEAITLSPNVDEDAIVKNAEREKNTIFSPQEVVSILAHTKAFTILDHIPLSTGLVIGADSVFVLDNVIYGKPHTPEIARKRLRAQRNRTGTLYTGQCLLDTTQPKLPFVTKVASTQVKFSDISDEDIEAYISTGEPLYVAGSFTLDGLGSVFVEHIDGDPSTVIGLSLPLLRNMVHELGYKWTHMWSQKSL